MPRPSYRTRCAILAGLTLLVGPAAAQAPPPARSPTVTASPQVTTLLNQIIAAHQALPSLSATIVLRTVTDAEPIAITTTETLAYRRPNEAQFTVTNRAGVRDRVLSDGKTSTIYDLSSKSYTTKPLPLGTNVIPMVLNQAAGLVAPLLGRPEHLKELLAHPGVTAQLGSPVSISGVPASTVEMTFPAPPGYAAHYEFAVGSADHLLRRFVGTITITRNGVTTTTIYMETVTVLMTHPVFTADDFAPPPSSDTGKDQPTKPSVK